MTYLCSLRRRGRDTLLLLFDYLERKHQQLFGEPLPDIECWVLVECPLETPLQRNLDGDGLGVDCGVFMCMFIDRIMQNSPTFFRQEDMVSYRELICSSILKNQIHIWDGEECNKYFTLKF